jgi:hypothetical protein
MQHSATKLAKGTRVITVQQPWATLIALGEKPVENRSWHTSYTGTLAIASSKAFPKHRREDCENPGVKKMLRKHGLSADDLPRGKVLCVTVLLECRQRSDGGYGFVLDRKRLKVFNPPISIPPGGMHLGFMEVVVIARRTGVGFRRRFGCDERLTKIFSRS